MMSSYFSVIVKRNHDQSDLQKKAFNLGLRVPEGGRAYGHPVGASQLRMAQGFETSKPTPPPATHLHQQSHAPSSKATPPNPFHQPETKLSDILAYGAVLIQTTIHNI